MHKRYQLWGLVICLVLLCTLAACKGESSSKDSSKDEKVLTVFNYGDYIDVQTLKMFEKETGIKVKYEQYVTPEDMYTKYQSGAIDYDLICTSDYMIEKMIRARQVEKVDKSNMKYLGNIDKRYLKFCQSFDPKNEYAVPYFWGTVGILYNKKMVKEPVNSWSILWDKQYKDEIVMENSMRDAFLVPLKWKGKSLNSKNKEELNQALHLLEDQKSILEAYLVDESRDAMIAGDAAMAVVYSGDATIAIDSNPDLAYTVPEEGSNIWFDCWFIPDSCRHKKAAEQFIDFMNREDVAMKNFNYIYYGTPNKAVYDQLDQETKEDPTIFPPDSVLEKCEVYKYLGSDMDKYYNDLWKELKSR